MTRVLLSLVIVAQTTFSSKTEIVAVPVTVTDASGHRVAPLPQSAFQLFDEGKRQTISLFEHHEVPVSVGLVVDHSASMHPKLPLLQKALAELAHAARADDQFFVVNFSDEAVLGLAPDTPFTSSSEALDRALGAMPISSTTSLYDGLVRALQHMEQARWPKRALVVVSDGGDNSSRRSADDVIHLAERSGAVIHTIGLTDMSSERRDRRLLERLSQDSGGASYFPATSDDAVKTIQQIGEDLRDQYILGFVPEPKGKSGAHELRVTVETQGKERVRVRARRTYLPR